MKCTHLFARMKLILPVVSQFFNRTGANHRATKKTRTEMELLVLFCAIDRSSRDEWAILNFWAVLKCTLKTMDKIKRITWAIACMELVDLQFTELWQLKSGSQCGLKWNCWFCFMLYINTSSTMNSFKLLSELVHKNFIGVFKWYPWNDENDKAKYVSNRMYVNSG